MSINKAFWQKQPSKVWLHEADENSKDYAPHILIVFIHGIHSGNGIWSETRIRNLFKNSKCEPDAIAFGYASFPLFQSSNNGAAQLLESAVGEIVKSSREKRKLSAIPENIIIVAHSNGGRIVKQLLTRKIEEFTKKYLKEGAELAGADVAPNVRHVYYICVPHGGATATATAILTIEVGIQCVFFLPAAIIGKVVGIASKACASLGWNSIFQFLMATNRSKHKRDEDEIRRVLHQANSHDIPTPQFTDIAASLDEAASPYAEKDNNNNGQSAFYRMKPEWRKSGKPSVVFHGAHALGTVWDSGAASVIESSLRVLRDSRRSAIAVKTISENRTRELLQHQRSQLTASFQLIGESAHLCSSQGPGKSPSTNLTPEVTRENDHDSGQQAGVCEFLYHECTQTISDARGFVIFGSGGVGKSRMLGRLARRLNIRYLQNLSSSNPPALLVHLDELDIPDTKVAELRKATVGNGVAGIVDLKNVTEILDTAIADAWANFASKVCSGNPGFDREWFQRDLLGNPVVLILDGIDTFLLNYHIPWTAFESWLDTVRHRIHQKYSVVILGFRAGQFGLEKLATDFWRRVRIAPMTEEIAARLIPDSKKLIKLLREHLEGNDANELINFILSPMVLPKLVERSSSSELGKQRAGKLLTKASVLEYVLEAHCKLDKTADRRPEKDYDTQERMLDAVVLGRLFYEETRPNLTMAEIRKLALTRMAQWDSANANEPHGSKQIRESLLRSFQRIIQNDSCLKYALNTVFIQKNAGHTSNLDDWPWCIEHALWSDYLCAAYYKYAIEAGVIRELGAVAFHPDITQMTGDLLGAWTLDAEQVVSAARLTKKEKNILYLSNIFAVASWNPDTKYPVATINALLNCVRDEEIPEFPKVLILNGIGVKSLAKPVSVKIIKDATLPGSTTQGDASEWRGQILQSTQGLRPDLFPITYTVAELWRRFLGDTSANIQIPEELHRPGLETSFGVFPGQIHALTLQKSIERLVRIGCTLDGEMFQARGIPTWSYLLFLTIFRKHGQIDVDVNQLLLKETCERSDFANRLKSQTFRPGFPSAYLLQLWSQLSSRPRPENRGDGLDHEAGAAFLEFN